MKKLIFAIGLIISTVAIAQDQYTKGMSRAMELWGQQKTTEASNLFERIAMAEEDNWIPYYYAAMANTSAAFQEKDETKLKQQLEKAQEFIAIAENISPNNAEILIQEAMINMAYMAFDGATYGMTLSGKNIQIYNRALELAPENPRVLFSKAEWDMGTARYFGKNTTPYCKDVERAVELFANFRPSEEPFYPDWGEDRAQEVLAQCKS